ncbi:MAG: tRNA dihydrouridine synthase DusB [Methylococcaceae bacterium]|nr:tRNA dihydrouridine synthase DusB [Methylococcaceae bacterium]
MLQIGNFQLSNNLILAPMAGITDAPFRELCTQFGAGLTVSEMVASNPILRHHPRTLLRAEHSKNSGLRSVQILGTNAQDLADAARFNVENGAQIIDINMGCPAKKVCSVAAGSALLRDENLVKEILDAVVNSVDVPVTLKIRTGWDSENKNALTIAKIAEDSGVAALTIHGRTRACKFEGFAEYETIKRIKQAVKIPIIANGDIDSPQKARFVLDETGADAIMIGRAAQGNPWIFQRISHFLTEGELLKSPQKNEIYRVLTLHLENLYSFYGSGLGVRLARKHIGWYLRHIDNIDLELKTQINQTLEPIKQLDLVRLALDL